MTAFSEFLHTGLSRAGAFPTADVIASFLPLARQVAEAHAAGRVAPLMGIEELHVDGVRIWYEESRETEPTFNPARLKKLQPKTGGLEVVAEHNRTLDVDEGHTRADSADVGKRGEEVVRPVYLPGYVSCEHEIEHHDPLTDTFSLGLILASMACGLDFNDEAQLTRFVQNRHNLFALNPGLEPVLARAMTVMTELERQKRPQDLTALLDAIENYREQNVDFDVELTSVSGYETRDRVGKQQVVLSKLQERLFEISRRNRLLHFRATLGAVNLTEASVPLAIDVRNIKQDELLTWHGQFRKEVLSQSAVPLNRYLNMREAVYLPSLLDRIRVDASRDRKEYGFAQLRLIVAFLRWANLKESPPELYQSPLVMLPVELVRKKGIQDTFALRLQSTDAEVNPVVRYLFRELYGIELPDTIDLASTSLEDFHENLAAQITASDRGVTLNRIDRPRIDLIHDRARRRLDQYRRRVRLSGRGVRRYLNLDYSYDAANYHPLGIRLFNEVVKPADTHLHEVVASAPPPEPAVTAPQSSSVTEVKRSAFALREAEQNPFVWEFDLCSVTLANMKYRKMSLVRDYDELCNASPENPAFDAVFSLAPRSVDDGETSPLQLEERYDVVPCDPTQAQAIADAHSDASYIIQGPPGTGKSQTITNLIADYVARGKRVLFVCEKRAAIDVVYHRLKQRDLHELCCLIHDSQADKKEFVMDLKRTYETFLEQAHVEVDRHSRRREEVIAAVKAALEPLQQFQSNMTAEPQSVGASVRHLLGRLVELRNDVPELTALQWERSPFYADWHLSRDELERLYENVREIQSDGVLAHHPFGRMSPAIVQHDRPIEFVSNALEECRGLIDRLDERIGRVDWPFDDPPDLAGLDELTAYSTSAAFLTQGSLIQLTNESAPQAVAFRERMGQLESLSRDVAEKEKHASSWKQRLSREEAKVALAQAKAFAGNWLAMLTPAWWRLRSVLHRAQNFGAGAVRPTWVQALESLDALYDSIESREAEADAIRAEFGIEAPLDEFNRHFTGFMTALPRRSGLVRRFHERLLAQSDLTSSVAQLEASRAAVVELQQALAGWLADWDDYSLTGLRDLLMEIDEELDELPAYLHCLREISELGDRMAHALRTLPLQAVQLEAAAAQHSLDELYAADRRFQRFDLRRRQRQLGELKGVWTDWQTINAEAVREVVRQRFLEQVRITSLPAADLTSEQKERKRPYNRGRRELEHEFGKTMRYKAIRDLVADDSGLVVRDLKPVWLMSPLSVADTLPLDADMFDVVIFDEASQITLEEAVPCLFRARQSIVVGDEMQLPPTDFFSARRSDDEESLTFEEGGELIQYDLNSDSLLNHAGRNLRSRLLGWHYRSRSESLVSFSNRCFYNGRLLTVPEETVVLTKRPELIVKAASDADSHASEVLSRAVSFHFVASGVYEKRRNRAEAEYIAHLVRNLLRAEPRRSIGVVAFSEAQQEEIDQALRRLGEQDREFAEQLESELEREDDGQFVGLLVKNLENIQGDERDVVIMSVCYGPDSEGKIRMHFGPINRSGGEKRLNVAFTRAKHHMVLVSSMRHSAITNEYNVGANCLKTYLHYAEAASIGDSSAVSRVLQSLARLDDEHAATATDVVVAQVADALRDRGWQVDLDVGHSQFRCNLAVRKIGETQYRLGILVDTSAWYAQTDLVERELLKPTLLEAFGWSIAVVLTKDWFHDREDTLKRLEQRLAGEPEHGDVQEPEASSVGATTDGDNEASELAHPRDKPSSTNDDEPSVPEGTISADDSAGPEPEDESTQQPPDLLRYLEYVDNSSFKFWEITVRDCEQVVRFGRIGTQGQVRTRTATTPEAARTDAERQATKKLDKGYVDMTDSREG